MGTPSAPEWAPEWAPESPPPSSLSGASARSHASDRTSRCSFRTSRTPLAAPTRRSVIWRGAGPVGDAVGVAVGVAVVVGAIVTGDVVVVVGVDGDDGEVRGKLARRGVVADHPPPPDRTLTSRRVVVTWDPRDPLSPASSSSAGVGGVVGRRLAHGAVFGVHRRAERADERVVVRLDGAVIVEADDVAIAKELRGGADPGQAAIARVSRVARRGAVGGDGRAGAVDRCVAAVASGRIGDRGDAPRAREEREREAEADACASRRASSNRDRAARGSRAASPRAPRPRHREMGPPIVRSSRRQHLALPLGRVYG